MEKETNNKKSILLRIYLGILGSIGLALFIYPQLSPNLIFIKTNTNKLKTEFATINDTTTAGIIMGSIRVKNSSIKSGHVTSIIVKPLFSNPQSNYNKEKITFSVVFIDKLEIGFQKEKDVGFSILFYFRNLNVLTSGKKFDLMFSDNNDKIIHNLRDTIAILTVNLSFLPNEN